MPKDFTQRTLKSIDLGLLLQSQHEAQTNLGCESLCTYSDVFALCSLIQIFHKSTEIFYLDYNGQWDFISRESTIPLDIRSLLYFH